MVDRYRLRLDLRKIGDPPDRRVDPQFTVHKARKVLELTFHLLPVGLIVADARVAHIGNVLIERTKLPSTGAMVAALSKGKVDAESYDREAPARIKAQLY